MNWKDKLIRDIYDRCALCNGKTRVIKKEYFIYYEGWYTIRIQECLECGYKAECPNRRSYKKEVRASLFW